MPIKLNVPFAERALAKAAGAWWRPELKTWVIPDQIHNIDPFERWIPYTDGCIVTKPYLIATAQIKCWKCHRNTPVIALGAKRYYTDIYSLDDDAGDAEGNQSDEIEFRSGFWKLCLEPTLFSYAVTLDPLVVEFLAKSYPFYKFVYSKTADETFWANTCVHCGLLQSTNAQHDEPGGVFCPLPLSYKPNPIPVAFAEFELPFDYHIDADYGGMGYYHLIFP